MLRQTSGHFPGRRAQNCAARVADPDPILGDVEDGDGSWRCQLVFRRMMHLSRCSYIRQLGAVSGAQFTSELHDLSLVKDA